MCAHTRTCVHTHPHCTHTHMHTHAHSAHVCTHTPPDRPGPALCGSLSPRQCSSGCIEVTWSCDLAWPSMAWLLVTTRTPPARALQCQLRQVGPLGLPRAWASACDCHTWDSWEKLEEQTLCSAYGMYMHGHAHTHTCTYTRTQAHTPVP